MRTRAASECSRRLSQLDAQRGVLLLQSLVLRIRIRPDDSVANPKTCLESARGWLHLGVPAEISLVGWSAFLSRSTAVFKPRGAAPLLDASLRPSSTLGFATRLTSHRGSLSSLRSSSHPRFAVPHRGPPGTPADPSPGAFKSQGSLGNLRQDLRFGRSGMDADQEGVLVRLR